MAAVSSDEENGDELDGGMSGFLHVENGNKRKKKSWKQRWVELNAYTGILEIRRHQRRSADETPIVLSVDEQDAAVTIQASAHIASPTPFCFSVSSAGQVFYMCAQTGEEFQDWVDKISSFINSAELTKGNTIDKGDTTNGTSVSDTSVSEYNRPPYGLLLINIVAQIPESPTERRQTLFAIEDGSIGYGMVLVVFNSIMG